MKFIRRILAGLAVIALAFKGVASFLSWVERQDDQPAEAWLDEDELDESELPPETSMLTDRLYFEDDPWFTAIV